MFTFDWAATKMSTALMNLSGTRIDSVHECAPLDKLILDLDSSISETHGE